MADSIVYDEKGLKNVIGSNQLRRSEHQGFNFKFGVSGKNNSQDDDSRSQSRPTTINNSCYTSMSELDDQSNLQTSQRGVPLNLEIFEQTVA